MPLSSSELILRRSALGRGLVADRFADQGIAARGLLRMQSLMERLGYPQHQYPVIHIAGSKGKGTTAHMTAALFSAHGYRTGRYTSPHLQTWNERIAIDNQVIHEEDFARVLELVDGEMTRLEQDQPDLGKCNAFELLTAAAFVYFAAQHVVYAVVEVGLGGRFDSTNIVQATVSVITRIEREHEDILGPEFTDIAWNKAGIISSDSPVVVAGQDPVALDVIEQRAAESGARIFLEDRDWTVTRNCSGLTYRGGELIVPDLTIALPGLHNQSNAGAALSAASLALTNGVLDPALCRETLAEIRIPGRFERLAIGSPRVTWVLDVAHTRESIAALLDAAERDPTLRSPGIMLALLLDKPADDILQTIADRIDVLILPSLSHRRAIPAHELAEIATRLGLDPLITNDVDSAITAAQRARRPMIVTGSFTLVGQVRTALVANQTRAL